MKIFRPFIISLAITLMYVVSTNAQTEKSQRSELGKVAVINFESLKDEKTGIKEFANINYKLEIEFKPQQKELVLLGEKAEFLFKQLREFELHPGEIKARELEEIHKSKLTEYNLAGCEILHKQQQVKSLYEKRYSELARNLNQKIINSLKLFANEKGFAVVLDSSQNNFLVESETIDVTNEFIQFYNNQTEKK